MILWLRIMFFSLSGLFSLGVRCTRLVAQNRKVYPSAYGPSPVSSPTYTHSTNTEKKQSKSKSKSNQSIWIHTVVCTVYVCMHACMHASMHACMYVMYVMYMYVYNASAHVSIQFVCSCLNISKFRKTYLYNIVVGFLYMYAL